MHLTPLGKGRAESLCDCLSWALNPNSQTNAEEEQIFSQTQFNQSPQNSLVKIGVQVGIGIQGPKYVISQTSTCSLRQDLSTEPSHRYYFLRALNFRPQHMLYILEELHLCEPGSPMISASVTLGDAENVNFDWKAGKVTVLFVFTTLTLSFAQVFSLKHTHRHTQKEQKISWLEIPRNEFWWVLTPTLNDPFVTTNRSKWRHSATLPVLAVTPGKLLRGRGVSLSIQSLRHLSAQKSSQRPSPLVACI